MLFLFRAQFYCRVRSHLTFESTHIFSGSRSIVLQGVCAAYRVNEAATSRVDCANANRPASDCNGSERLFQERSKPSTRFRRPRPDEEAILNHNHPDANGSVGFGTSPDAEDLGTPKKGQCAAGEVFASLPSVVRRHGVDPSIGASVLLCPQALDRIGGR